MKNIQKGLEELVEKFKLKGYDVSAFLTNAGFPDDLLNSVNRYLEASLSGDEEGLANKICLHTYLEYEGEDKPCTLGYFWVKYEQQSFEIRNIEINRESRYGVNMKTIRFESLEAALLPPFKEIMAMVIEDKKKVGRKINR